MKRYVETGGPDDLRETEPGKTVEVTGTRNKLDQVFIEADGNWLKGQKIQEEGGQDHSPV